MSSKVIELKLPENQFIDVLQAAKGKFASYIMRLVKKENERLERKCLRKEWDDNAPVYSIEDLDKIVKEAKKAGSVTMKYMEEHGLTVDDISNQGKSIVCETDEETHEHLNSLEPVK